jgi:hypothetical protein
LDSRIEGGQAASNAAIFTSVDIAPSLGGDVGRFGAPVPSSGSPTRIATLPDWTRGEWLNQPRRIHTMNTDTHNNDEAFNTMRIASEQAATAKIFSEVHKAEAQTAKALTLSTLLSAIDATGEADSGFEELNAILDAIGTSNCIDNARTLAKIGQHLVFEWSGINDRNRDAFNEQRTALKAAEAIAEKEVAAKRPTYTITPPDADGKQFMTLNAGGAA